MNRWIAAPPPAAPTPPTPLAGPEQYPSPTGPYNQIGAPEGVAAARWDHGHSGAQQTIVRSARITTGNVDLPDTTGDWEALPGFELAIPAAAGEWVEVSADLLADITAGSALDLAVIVGTTLVRFAATGTSTPVAGGSPGWDLTDGGAPAPGVFGFTTVGGDLDAGTVRFVVACRGDGTGRLYASTTIPFRWRALNLRTVG